MKKILYIEYELDCGGRQKFSLDFLERASRDLDIEIDLCLLLPGGQWDCKIPSNVKRVNVFDIPEEEIKQLVQECDKKYALATNIKGRHFIRAAKIILNRKYRKNRILRYANILQHLRRDLSYDYIVTSSLTASVLMPKLAAEINAKCRFGWIHCAFCAQKDRKKFNLPKSVSINHLNHDTWMFESMDKIVCVSDSIKQLFDYYYPQYSNRSIVMYNAVDVDTIITKAEESVSDIPVGKIKIATVGRCEIEKGPLLMIQAAKKLKKAAVDFVWYYIGAGSLLEKARKIVKKENLSSQVVFLDMRNNPYPYIKACDIYCQPSLTEAYCTTVNEARILCKPVVATEFSGIHEQITDGVDGFIAEINANALAKALQKAIEGNKWEELQEKVQYPNDAEKNSMFSLNALLK